MRAALSLRNDRGFTLIELLVVILIVAILSAIALPAFLGQRARAQDTNAKSDARNMVSQMEACFTEEDKYNGCSSRLTSTRTGLSIGSGPGQVQVTTESDTGYTVVATSRAVTGGADHTFTIVHSVASGDVHDCTVRGQGGCPFDGRW